MVGRQEDGLERDGILPFWLREGDLQDRIGILDMWSQEVFDVSADLQEHRYVYVRLVYLRER